MGKPWFHHDLFLLPKLPPHPRSTRGGTGGHDGNGRGTAVTLDSPARRRARTDDIAQRIAVGSTHNARQLAGHLTWLIRNLHKRRSWLRPPLSDTRFDLAQTVTTVAGRGITIIACLERRIEHAIATTSTGTIGPARGIRHIRILSAEITRFSRFQYGVAAEIRRERDIVDLQTLTVDTCCTVRTLVIANATTAHAVHAAAGIALEIVRAALRRSEQAIITACVTIVHVPVITLLAGIELAIPAERRGNDAASGRATMTGGALLIQRTLPAAPLLA